jgi:peptide/nickel transport system substrate-binding protein
MLTSCLSVFTQNACAAGAQTTLRIGMSEPVDNLSPFIGITDDAYIFYGLVYDNLIAVDQDMNPKPNLALSWYVVPDIVPYGSVWQYNLTHNAKWHDGEPFTAEDVVFTFNYQIGANWATMWAYQPYTAVVGSVEMLDDYTVRIHFIDYDGNPSACAFGASLAVPIVPKHIWQDIPPPEAGFSYPNKHPIGTGPFMCTDQTYSEFLRGDRLILYKNPEYHGTLDYGQQVRFDRLVLEFYSEPAAMLSDIERGAIDLAALDAPNYDNLLSWLTSHPTNAIKTFAGLKCNSFSVEIATCMNPSGSSSINPLRLDLNVRKAMAYATDKNYVVNNIYRGFAEKGSAILSPVQPYWYWEPGPSDEYSFNITKANQILDDAGYPWNGDHTVRVCQVGNPLYPAGGKPLKFQLIVEQELYEDRLTAMYLVDQWKQIGITVDPLFVNTAMWSTIVYSGVYDLCITYWSGDPDPNYLLYIQSSYALGGWSDNFYNNPEYDQNYTDQLLTVNASERLPYVVNCQKLSYRDCPYIVTCYPYGCYAWREDHFTGWGDWATHQGRALSSFWSANPLFFDLVPVGTNEAPIAILDNVAGHVNDTLEITAYAWDPEGDNMTYFIDFGDNSTQQNATGNVPSDGQISVTHAFSMNGSYMMSLVVSDGDKGDSQASEATIVLPGEDAPPSNVRIQPSKMRAAPGESVVFNVTGKDLEGDPVSLDLNFSDGTSPYSETELNTDQGFLMSQTHAFSAQKDYAITLTVNDTYWVGSVVLLFSVGDFGAENAGGGGGPSTILLVGIGIAVAVVAVAAVLLMKRRGGREEADVKLP